MSNVGELGGGACGDAAKGREATTSGGAAADYSLLFYLVTMQRGSRRFGGIRCRSPRECSFVPTKRRRTGCVSGMIVFLSSRSNVPDARIPDAWQWPDRKQRIGDGHRSLHAHEHQQCAYASTVQPAIYDRGHLFPSHRSQRGHGLDATEFGCIGNELSGAMKGSTQ